MLSGCHVFKAASIEVQRGDGDGDGEGEGSLRWRLIHLVIITEI